MHGDTHLVIGSVKIHMVRNLIGLRLDTRVHGATTDRSENDRYDGKNSDSLCNRYQELGFGFKHECAHEL